MCDRLNEYRKKNVKKTSRGHVSKIKRNSQLDKNTTERDKKFKNKPEKEVLFLKEKGSWFNSKIY